MSSSPAVLRTLAFGDVTRTVWGAAWIPGGEGSAVAMIGGDAVAPVVSSLRLSIAENGSEWRLDGVGFTLIAVPAGEIVDVQAVEENIVGSDQLCRVTGRFEQSGAEHAVDCLGLRSSRSGGFDLGKLESVRAVSTWFEEPDEGFALTAFRGRKAKHHDSDVLTATVLGPEPSAAGRGPAAVDHLRRRRMAAPRRPRTVARRRGRGRGRAAVPASRGRRGYGRPDRDGGRRSRPARRAVPLA